MAQVIMFNPTVGRKVQVDAEKVDSAIANGLVKHEEYMKEKLRKEQHWMKGEKGEVIPVSGDYLEYMKAREYVECTESGEPLEKGVIQTFKDAVEKVVKRKSKKSDTSEAETEPGEVSA